MGTTYYEVVPVGIQWAMKVAGHDRTWCYPTQSQALIVSVNAARHLWEMAGISSGVRLLLPDGNWQHAGTFGRVTPLPDSPESPVSAAWNGFEGCIESPG